MDILNFHSLGSISKEIKELVYKNIHTHTQICIVALSIGKINTESNQNRQQ